MDINKRAGNLIILTGERNSGKTTLCSLISQKARSENRHVAGVLSPAVFEGGEKKAIDLINLATGGRRNLALLRKSGDEGILTSYWTFSSQGLEWGNNCLKEAVPCDLLVVDELGPLELLRGQGLTAGLEAVDSRLFSLALVVVRPELLEIALKRWPHGRIITINAPYEATSLEETIRREYEI